MLQIPVTIDRSSPVPLYHQLYEQLSAAIETGRLKPGDAFENELALADRLQLSRPTVASQVIHRRDELTSLFDDISRRGQKPTTEVLDFVPDLENPVAAEALGLPADTPLLFIERLRLAGDVPTAVMQNWIPPRFADLTESEVAKGSLYAALRARGARPAVAHQTIGARRPSAKRRAERHRRVPQPPARRRDPRPGGRRPPPDDEPARL